MKSKHALRTLALAIAGIVSASAAVAQQSSSYF